MAKRTAVKLVADGSEFAQTADREIRSLRQKFAEAGRGLAKEFPEEFARGIKTAEAQVRGFSDEFARLSKSANLSGGVLSFDRTNLNAELGSARQYLMTQRELAAAIERVATEEGQAGVAARARVQAQTIEIQKTEEMVRAIEQEIALLNRLQGEIGDTATAHRRLTVVAGEQRAGMQQLSFQVADIASGFASGIPPMQIFAQQSTQVVQAMQMMTTKTTGMIGFLGGPWGLAFTAAATVAGSLAMKLWDNEDAMQAVSVASDNLGQTQGVLSKMFDLSTGKIANNTQALRDNVYMQMIAMQQKAIIARQEAGTSLAESGVGRTTPMGRFLARAQAFATGDGARIAFTEKGLARQESRGRNYEALIKAVAAGMPLETAGGQLDRAAMGDDAYFQVQQALFKASESFTAGKAARDMERALGGKLGADYITPQKGGSKKSPKGADAAKAAEAMANTMSEAYEKAVQLRGQFDAMPSDIDRANNALIDAQQLIAQAKKILADPKATAENKKRALDVLTVAKQAVALADRAPTKVLTDQLSVMDEQVQSQRLLAEGRMGEYNTMQDNLELARLLGAENLSQLDAMIRTRKVSQDDLDAYYKKRQQARLITIEMQRQQEQQQRALGYLEDRAAIARQGIYDLLSGKGVNAAKTALKSLAEVARREMTDQIFTAVFGDRFDQQKLKILGLDKVDESGKRFALSVDKTSNNIRDLGNVVEETVRKLQAVNLTPDNAVAIAASSPRETAKVAGANFPYSDDIVVTGNSKVGNLSGDIRKLNKTTADGLGKNGAISKGFANLGPAFSAAMQGAAYGQAASGVLRSLGVKQSNTGAAIGGAIGNLIMPGIGGAIGGALGGTIGGLFKKTPKGAATVTSLSESASFVGSKSLRESSMGLAGSVQGSLQQIADALGGDAGSFAVSIGQRKKKFTVDPTGKGRTKGAGVLTFASEEEAVMAALRDALADGAIRGISAASQRILQAGGDLEKAIEKASLIESIPKLLKARTNPVAGALDDLNEKWAKTVAALKEGAATAAQFADAEKLYQIERDEIMKAANDNLKSFINGLNFGPNSGLSLRDQSANARAELQPYLDAINSGQIADIDRDKYLEAADSFLQISRALNGSGSGYFSTVDELRTATQSLLDQSQAGASAAEAVNPFAEATAKNTADAVNLLSDMVPLLAQIAGGTLGHGVTTVDGSFIGTGRNFLNSRVALA